MSAGSTKDWLIRDTSNCIFGPMERAEILAQIRSQRLRGKTEIAQANAYWFTLDERQELLKFFPELGEGGRSPGIHEMTATMTKSEMPNSRQLEAMESGGSDQTSIIEGFSPPRPESVAPESPILGNGEWLSAEYAEEFGLEMMEAEPESSPTPEATAALPKQSVSPNFHEERTLPDLEITPQKASYQRYDATEEDRAKQKKKVLIIAVTAFFLVGCLGAVIFFFEANKAKVNVIAPNASAKKSENNLGIWDTNERLRAALLLFDSKLLQASIAELESTHRGSPLAPMGTAILKGSFKFDNDGAASALEIAKGLSLQDPAMLAEVENLYGIYSLPSNAAEATLHFKAAIDAISDEPSFRYNYALANFIGGNLDAASKQIVELAKEPSLSPGVYYQVLLLQALVAQESGAAGKDSEQIVRKAIEVFPAGTEAKLLLAVITLSNSGVATSRSAFQDFLFEVGELEQNQSLVNFRLAKNPKIVSRGLEIVRNSQSVTKNSDIRPDPTFLAVEASLSSLRNEYSEAAKILDHALRLAPGDHDVLLSLAYLKFREEKYEEVVDLLKDKGKESHENFPFLKMLGYAYLHLDRLALAEQSLSAAARLAPNNNEVQSLLGDVIARGVNGKDSVGVYQSAIGKNPYDARAFAGLVRSGRSDLLQQKLYKELTPF